MSCRRNATRYGLVALLMAAVLAVSVAVCAQDEDDGAPSGPLPPGVVAAKIKIKTGVHDVRLVGRREEKVIYQFAESTDVTAAIEVEQIERASFTLEYDGKALRKAILDSDWLLASEILFRTVRPAFPFIDLPGNEAAEMAMRAGSYLLKAASVRRVGGFTPEAIRQGEKQYKTAGAIFNVVGRADWYDRAEEARMRAALCLVLSGKATETEQLLADATVPGEWDPAYAFYTLARAHVQLTHGEHAKAIEEAVQSLLFQTKEADSFPEALLMTGHCYEAMAQWYRARDVYFEVGRLFHRNEWGTAAIARLTFIMDEELTAEDEPEGIERVFFGLDEDVNAKVQEFLERIADEQEADD